MDSKPETTVTINRMRELLRKDYAHLTVLEVEQYIAMVELMADITIEEIKRLHTVPKSP